MISRCVEIRTNKRFYIHESYIKVFIHSSLLLKGGKDISRTILICLYVKTRQGTTESSTITLYVNNADCFLGILGVVIRSARQLYTQTIHASCHMYLLTK